MATAAQLAILRSGDFRRSVISQCHYTHQFDAGTSAIATGTVFGARNQNITFGGRIAVTGASASGIVFEFGDSTTGVKLAITGGSFYIAAGAAAGAAGLDGNVSYGPLNGVSEFFYCLAINSQAGEARLWANGSLLLAASSASAMTTWAAASNGAVGAAQDGTSTQRGQTINTAPSNFVLRTPLYVADLQLPRAFS